MRDKKVGLGIKVRRNSISIFAIFSIIVICACQLIDNSISGSAISPPINVEVDDPPQIIFDSDTIVFNGTQRDFPISMTEGLGNESEQVLQTNIVSSSNESIIPLTGIILTCVDAGAGCTGQLTIIPIQNQLGIVEIVISVSDGSKTVAKTIAISVEDAITPIYSDYSEWNYYIQPDDPLKPFYMQKGDACPETNYTSLCLHGGELRQFPAIGYTSCKDLSVSDELDALNWICVAGTNPVRFYSHSLKPYRGLRHLISASSWRQNRVTLYEKGVPQFTSKYKFWWTTTVEPLPINDQATDSYRDLQSDTIYTLASSRATSGYRLTNKRTSIVIFDGQTLSFSGTTTNYCHGSFAIFDSSPNLKCLLAIYINSFVWIEGNFSGKSPGLNANHGIMAYTSQHINFKDVVVHSFAIGINFLTSNSIFIKDSQILSNTSRGISGTQIKTLLMNNVILANNGDIGLAFDEAIGIPPYVGSSLNNILSVNNGNVGIYISGDRSNFINLTNITSINNSLSGISYVLLTSSTSNNILSANNGDRGVKINASFDLVASQIAAVDNQSFGLSVNNSIVTGAKIYDNLVVGNNNGNTMQCSSDEVLTNLIDNSCSTNGVDGEQLLDNGASLRINRTLTNSIVGTVTSEITNVVGAATGTALHTNILSLDWSSFDNSMRSWGEYDAVATFPHTDFQGECASGSTCQIWDTSLKANDTVFLNTSGDGVSQNPPVVNNGPCPALLDGNKTTTNINTWDPSTYLTHAAEIVGDQLGDEDGLCESNEFCIYSPNFGAYQGHGDFKANSCQFADGVLVKNVKIYFYPQNGRL